MGIRKQGIGAALLKCLTTTMAGGVLFLLPTVIVLIVLGQAMRLAGKIVQPISALLPVGADYRVGVITFLAVLVLVVISLVAGVAARTVAGKRLTRWFENSWLSSIPQYQLMKSMAEGLARIENAKGVTPAMISIEGGWQIGYLLESLENGFVAVFLPQAPTPMSGNLMYMPADRVRPLSISMIQAMAIVKRMGVGSRETLRGVDLTLPAGA